jgi:penicillin-binding protein 1A
MAKTLRGLGLIALPCLAAAVVVAVWALRDTPWKAIADGSLKPVVVLEASDGEQLMSQGPYQGGYASLEEFPKSLVDAVISAEDRRFYEHPGIDVKGIARAFFANLRAGTVVEGGSTITQQLVKIQYLESERTLRRKIQEAAISLWLDHRLGKDEILTRYLNNVYLGAGATGIPAAARIYFGKEPGELVTGESAMLAGIIRAPSQLNPLENPDGARRRTESVLDAMVATGRLDEAEAAKAKRDFAELRPSRPAIRSGSWFADWVGEEAREIAGPYRGTIVVRTSLMPRLQALAEQAVAATMEAEGAASNVSQAALVAMTPDGGVVAMVGGRDYESSEFNRAVDARRQPGSAFKLFTYYAALKAGISPGDLIEDAPISVDGWEPENFGGGYSGTVTVAEAFARSLNAATVALAMTVGPGKVIEAARELGIDAGLEPMPSVALGAFEVSLLDLTGAYASVRAGRAPIEPWGIASFHADGQPRSFSVKASKPAETDLAAYQRPMVELLQLVVERGTGRAAAIDGFAAGKTGTSQNYRDAWFIGFSDLLVAGVWVGNDDETPMNDVTGGNLPARIWHDFMVAAAAELGGDTGGVTLPDTMGGDDPAGTADGGEAAPLAAGTPPASACNLELCSQMYRSFRESDCTYQPYRGPRRLCTQGGGAAPEADAAADRGAVAATGGLAVCNYRACSRRYRSFRPSDCTYQPYRGPRTLCTR